MISFLVLVFPSQKYDITRKKLTREMLRRDLGERIRFMNMLSLLDPAKLLFMDEFSKSRSIDTNPYGYTFRGMRAYGKKDWSRYFRLNMYICMDMFHACIHVCVCGGRNKCVRMHRSVPFLETCLVFFFSSSFSQVSIAMIGVGRPIYYEVRKDTNTMATILLFAQGVIVRLIFIFSASCLKFMFPFITFSECVCVCVYVTRFPLKSDSKRASRSHSDYGQCVISLRSAVFAGTGQSWHFAFFSANIFPRLQSYRNGMCNALSCWFSVR